MYKRAIRSCGKNSALDQRTQRYLAPIRKHNLAILVAQCTDCIALDVKRQWIAGLAWIELAQFDQYSPYRVAGLAFAPSLQILSEQHAHHLAMAELFSALKCENDLRKDLFQFLNVHT